MTADLRIGPVDLAPVVDGGDGPCQRPVILTFFSDSGASRKTEAPMTLTALADRIRTTTAPRKIDLPWLKLARFGDVRSRKNSLRHDANVSAITGVEVDYDSGIVSIEEAEQWLLKAGLLSLLYTSPSHTLAAPRWRVLCPTSIELGPDRRNHLMGRLNGVLRGVASSESWTLSQSYYFGRVGENPSHEVRLIEGRPIDLLDGLDEASRGKAGTVMALARNGTPDTGPLDEQALLGQIVAGLTYHVPMVRLLGHWAHGGVPMVSARERLVATMRAIPEAARDARWHTRFADIDRCLEDIYVKDVAARDGETASGDRRRLTARNSVDEPWPTPVDFLANSDTTGVPALRSDHLPDGLFPFVRDTAARMGVDPVSVALAAIVTCASVIHETWRIQPKQFDTTWTEEARLWGAIVGDPSILKTPVIAACTRPIERLDAEARRRHATDLAKYEATVAAQKAGGTDGDPPVGQHPPRLDRYLVEGTTVEALTEVLRDDADAKQHAPQGRVLVRQDEMSEWVAGFDRYRSGGRGGSDRGAYLRLFNGGRHVVDRVGRGSFAIANWSACILGGIQPGPIQKIAQEAADDGLLQRFLFAVPGRQSSGIDRAPDAAAIARYDGLIEALLDLRPPADGSNWTAAKPTPVRLAPEAQQERLAIDELSRAMAAMPDASGRLKAALGKWPGIFARLALCFHLIEAADAVVQGMQPGPLETLSGPTARRAATMLREVLLPHLLRAEAVMFSSAMTGHAAWIGGYILARPMQRLTLREIVQAYGALRPQEQRRVLHEVIESLVSMDWLRPEQSSNPTRPPAAWLVNPNIHTCFAARAADERAAREAASRRVNEALRRHRGGAG